VSVASALIFDYDGLLADTEELAASVLVSLLAERGVATGFESMVSFMGSTGPVNDAAWESWLLEWLGPDADQQAFETIAAERMEAGRYDVPARPGVVELLDEAHRHGWQVAIGTGASRARLDKHLERLGLLGRFDAIVTAADVTHGKPAPDIFLEAARRLGRQPSECVVLEDSIPGYEAARAAGMSVIICPCAVTRHATFPPEARVVGSLLEVELRDL
jgi:HAD superfamily hydrolase (TIGR01509 family)